MFTLYEITQVRQETGDASSKLPLQPVLGQIPTLCDGILSYPRLSMRPPEWHELQIMNFQCDVDMRVSEYIMNMDYHDW